MTSTKLVAATADVLGLDTALVEKDYWVTEVLRSVARPLDLPAPPGGAEARASAVRLDDGGPVARRRTA